MFCLKATNITKVFTHKKALDAAFLEIYSGQIHAVLGENGAGKSTLASIISGSFQANKGDIALGYSPFQTQSLKMKKVNFKNPREAQDKGIVMVHQKPVLSESLSVLENAILGDSRITCFFSKAKTKAKLNAILKEWDIELSLNKKGSELNGEESFYTELLSALYKNPKLLILDEPTALLAEKSRSIFFENLKKQAEKGLAIILITHNLEEALSYANFITVLKKGRVSLSKNNSFSKPLAISDLENALFIDSQKTNTNTKDKQRLKNNKTSFANEELSPKLSKKILEETPLFAIENLSFTGKNYPSLFNISFSVFKGGITYIHGQKASGIESLEEIITGIKNLSYSGSIFFDGFFYQSNPLYKRFFSKNKFEKTKTNLNNKISKKYLNPRILRKGGAAIISTNKTFRSSNPNLSILEFLSIYKNVDTKAKDAELFSKSLIAMEKMQIEIHEPVSALSGGMLQRLILERELSTEPKLLLFFEPAQGLDAQRLKQLASHLRSLSDMGKAILLVSANKENVFSEIADLEYEMRGGKLI